MKIINSLAVIIILVSLVFITSCYTSRYVDDHSRPIYKHIQEPVYEEVDKIEYRKTSSPVFSDQNQREVKRPIDIAALDFWSPAGTSFNYHHSMTNNFYNKLIAYPNVWDKLQPYKSENIKTMYRMSELHPGNSRLMNELSRGGIPFAVSGKVTNTSKPEFELNIYRTSDGIAILTREMKTTNASNAFDDAIRLLMREEAPNYLKEREIVRYESKSIIVGYHQKEDKVLKEEATYALVGSLIGLVLPLVIAMLL